MKRPFEDLSYMYGQDGPEWFKDLPESIDHGNLEN
jgi:hypothetical protein